SIRWRCSPAALRLKVQWVASYLVLRGGRISSTWVTASSRKPRSPMSSGSLHWCEKRQPDADRELQLWIGSDLALPLAQGRPYHLRDFLGRWAVHAAAILCLSPGKRAGLRRGEKVARAREDA